MGNSSSSSSGRGQHDDTVDFGHLVPQGVYTGQRDWNQAVVSQVIVARRLAPFYRPLEDYDESWDDDRILAARKELPDPDGSNLETTTRIEATTTPVSSSRSSHGKRPSLKEPAKPEAAVYRGAVECPICFLYYPPNINHSRCCDQAICTECFVQIKRNEPTTTHLVSEPAACPYCVQENFGVVYSPPPWRAGIGSDGQHSPWDSPKGSQSFIESSPYPTHKRRQKSFGAESPEVVLTDHIRPDWEAKLAAVRAAVTRRANRRIIMRQVGDRLIPVGVTSGRVQALSPEEAAAAEADAGGSRRSRRRQQAPPAGLEQYLGLQGQDLEEIMLMEAMRLSLIDHEEHQRKEAEEKRKQAAATSSSAPRDVPIAGSSSSQTPLSAGAAISSSPTPSAAPVSSSAPTHRSSSSLAAIRPSFLSRSRSPSPTPPVTGGDSRRANPPAFSTLTAALSTTKTASAFLASGGSSNGTSTPRPPTSSAINEDSPIPTITVADEASSSTPATTSTSTPMDPPQPRAPIPKHQDSLAISVISTDTQESSSAYEELASSPDSIMSDAEPLIPTKPPAHEVQDPRVDETA